MAEMCASYALTYVVNHLSRKVQLDVDLNSCNVTAASLISENLGGHKLLGKDLSSCQIHHKFYLFEKITFRANSSAVP